MKKRAFTLAEVLVTLGIVGVIAAITIPSLAMRCQKYVLKKQFKKKYLVLQQALDIVANDFGYPPNCYYWGTSPYGPATCAERDETYKNIMVKFFKNFVEFFEKKYLQNRQKSSRLTTLFSYS